MKKLKSALALTIFSIANFNNLFCINNNITNATDSNYKEIISQSNKPIVLKIYAEWCPACSAVKETYEKVAKKLNNEYIFLQADVDKSNNLAKKYNIEALPTFIFIKNGAVKNKELGSMNEKDLEDKITQSLS